MEKRTLSLALALALVLTLSLFPLCAQASTVPTVPAGFDLIHVGRYSSMLDVSDGMAAVSLNGKWGFVDAYTGKEVIAPQYDDINTDLGDSLLDYVGFVDGLAVVYKKGQGHGVITKTGAYIVPLGKYGFINSFNADGLAQVKNLAPNEYGDTVQVYGVIDRTGKEIVSPGKYGDNVFIYGSMIVAPASADRSKNENWIFLDKTGKQAIKTEYKMVFGYAGDGIWNVQTLDGRSVFIDATGKELFSTGKFTDTAAAPCVISGWSDKQDLSPTGPSGGLLVLTGGGGNDSYWSYTVIDRTGKIYFQCVDKYSQILPFSDGVAVATVFDKNNPNDPVAGKVLIDAMGKEVIPLKDDIKPANNGLVAVASAYEQGGYRLYNWGVYTVAGKEIVPPIYTAVGKDVAYTGDFPDGMIVAQEGGNANVYSFIYGHDVPSKRGIFDAQGNVIVPIGKYGYCHIAISSEGKCAVSTVDGIGFVNNKGAEIIPIQKFEVSGRYFKEGRVQVGVNNGSSDTHDYYFLVDKSHAQQQALSSASSWAREQIQQALNANLIPAQLQNNFQSVMTRQDFTAIAVQIYELVTGEEITGRVQFNDTTDINVQKAAAVGIVAGTGNGNYSPALPLTREQGATMIYNLAAAIGKPLPAAQHTFTDTISTWAAAGVGACQAAGIVSGVGEGRFAGQQPYTREQAVIMALRMYDIVK